MGFSRVDGCLYIVDVTVWANVSSYGFRMGYSMDRFRPKKDLEMHKSWEKGSKILAFQEGAPQKCWLVDIKKSAMLPGYSESDNSMSESEGSI